MVLQEPDPKDCLPAEASESMAQECQGGRALLREPGKSPGTISQLPGQGIPQSLASVMLGRLWSLPRVISGEEEHRSIAEELFEGARAGRGRGGRHGPAAAEPCSCTALMEGPRWHCHAPGHSHKGRIQEPFLACPGTDCEGWGSSSTATHPSAATAHGQPQPGSTKLLGTVAPAVGRCHSLWQPGHLHSPAPRAVGDGHQGPHELQHAGGTCRLRRDLSTLRVKPVQPLVPPFSHCLSHGPQELQKEMLPWEQLCAMGRSCP